MDMNKLGISQIGIYLSQFIRSPRPSPRAKSHFILRALHGVTGINIDLVIMSAVTGYKT